jgi:hypothetical protein
MRESVSFQRPERSMVSSGSTRVTCFPLEQPKANETSSNPRKT